MMICPVCDTSMLILEYDEVEIDYCDSCHGVWLDQGELEWLAGDEKEHWTVPAAHKSSRRCPRCRTRMREGCFPGTKVALDVCPNEHGLWFDRGELSDVLAAQGAQGAAARLVEYFGSLFGKSKNDKKDEQQ